MSPKQIGVTAAIILPVAFVGFCGLVGMADFLLIKKWGVDASISRGMERLGYFWPAIPAGIYMALGFLFGWLAGHFWSPQPPLTQGPTRNARS